MMTYEPFSIVVVPFPFTDSPNTKRRPALVVSSEAFQKQSGHTALLMITSSKHSHWSNDVEIENLNSAGLNVPSMIRQKYFTIDNRLIIKAVGVLATKDKNTVSNESKSVLAF